MSISCKFIKYFKINYDFCNSFVITRNFYVLIRLI